MYVILLLNNILRSSSELAVEIACVLGVVS